MVETKKSNSKATVRAYYVVGAAAIVLAVFVYAAVFANIADPSLRQIRLEQLYGFLALSCLYAALLARPLTGLFPRMHGAAGYAAAVPALAAATGYFALLHVYINFFKQLGGVQGLGFLGNQYLTALGFGLTGLLLILLFAAASAAAQLSIWPLLANRIWSNGVYVAGVVIFVHILMVGSHFDSLSNAIPRLLFVAVGVLLVIETAYINARLRARSPALGALGTVATIAAVAAALPLAVSTQRSAEQGGSGLNVHSQHIELAKEAAGGTTGVSTAVTNANNNPALAGDRTKRYTVSFEHGTVEPGQDTKLTFRIFDAASGSTDFNLQPINTKLSHLVIVDESLQYFQHIHPSPAGSITELAVSTTFPKAGKYRLYLNYQPSGAIEQQVGFSLQVGPGGQAAPTPVTGDNDTSPTSTVDGFRVSRTTGSYSAAKLTLGEQKISFRLQNGDGTPVRDLKPYLGAFGHLVLINQANYEYIHVHPYSTKVPAANDTSGPDVEFLPIGIYGPIKAGTYKAFAEFNPGGKLITVPFVIKVGE